MRNSSYLNKIIMINVIILYYLITLSSNVYCSNDNSNDLSNENSHRNNNNNNNNNLDSDSNSKNNNNNKLNKLVNIYKYKYPLYQLLNEKNIKTSICKKI